MPSAPSGVESPDVATQPTSQPGSPRGSGNTEVERPGPPGLPASSDNMYTDAMIKSIVEVFENGKQGERFDAIKRKRLD